MRTGIAGAPDLLSQHSIDNLAGALAQLSPERSPFAKGQMRGTGTPERPGVC